MLLNQLLGVNCSRYIILISFHIRKEITILTWDKNENFWPFWGMLCFPFFIIRFLKLYQLLQNIFYNFITKDNFKIQTLMITMRKQIHLFACISLPQSPVIGIFYKFFRKLDLVSAMRINWWESKLSWWWW